MSDNTQPTAPEESGASCKQSRSPGLPVKTSAAPKKQPTPVIPVAQQAARQFSTFKGSAEQRSDKKSSSSSSRSRSKYHDRNSLESIHSRFSVSSATNDDSVLQQNQQQLSDSTINTSSSSLSPSREPARASRVGASNRSRYVSPPAVHDHLEAKLVQCRHPSTADKRPLERLQTGPPQGLSLATLESGAAEAKPTGKPDQHDEHDKAAKVSLDELCLRREESCDETAAQSAKGRRGLSAPTTRADKPPFPFAGILASILASIFFSSSTICVKLLPDSQGLEEKTKAVFFRGVLMSAICALAIACRRTGFSIPRDEIWINVLRAIFGTLGIYGAYCSLKYISPGDSTALVFSSPIWTSILSYFIFAEPLQWIQLLGLPVCILGIVLIAHPALIVSTEHLSINHHHDQHQHTAPPINITNVTDTSDLDTLSTLGPEFEHRWPGVVIALGVSLAVSFTYIVLKFRKTTPIQTTTFWLGVCMSVTALAVMSGIGFGDIPDTAREWALLVGLGVTSWLGQSCLQWAFFYEAAGLLAIVRTLDVAVIFIMSAIFLDEDIYWTSILGASIIGLVVVSVMLNNWIKTMTCMNGLATPVKAAKEVAKELTIRLPMSEAKKVYTISKAA